MVALPGGKFKDSSDVVRLEIRVVGKNFRAVRARRQKVQDVESGS